MNDKAFFGKMDLVKVLRGIRAEIILKLSELDLPHLIPTAIEAFDQPIKLAFEPTVDHFRGVTKMDEPIKIAEDAIDPPPYHTKLVWEDLYSESDKIECEFKDLEPGCPFENNGCRYVKIHPLNHKNAEWQARRIQDDGYLAPHNTYLAFFEPDKKVLVLKQHSNGEEGGSLKFSELKEGERFSWKCELFKKIPLKTLHPCFENGPFIQIPTEVNAARIDISGDKSNSVIDQVFFEGDESVTRC